MSEESQPTRPPEQEIVGLDLSQTGMVPARGDTAKVRLDTAADLPAAPRPAQLELVLEGAVYRCRDGDILGGNGTIQGAFASYLPQLESRHLLFGQDRGIWFVFTPRVVKRPFSLDGRILTRGARQPLEKVRHHLSLDNLRIGVRLHPANASSLVGWMARVLPGRAFYKTR